MKISIITVVWNRVHVIAKAIQSVQVQTHTDIEHVIVDGVSTDGTLDVIKKITSSAILISEPDNGIYDAINKGIGLATGEIIGLVHSDDFLYNQYVLAEVAEAFLDPTIDAVYGDVVYFRHGKPGSIIRRYSSKNFSPEKIAWGWMPAHTALFVRRSVYEKYGLYKINFKIAADFEFVARVFGAGALKSMYIPNVWVCMQVGGVSTGGLKNKFILNKEVIRACRENSIKTNWFKVVSKYLFKLIEYIKH